MNVIALALLLLASPAPPVADVVGRRSMTGTRRLRRRRRRGTSGTFAAGAVFLGTDATERWTVEEFRRYSHPYFAKGKAWSFKAIERHVAFSADATVAWFDEKLDTPNLGPCRGSGVLVREKGAWKIAQYNLAVPIPNDLMKEIKDRIEKYEAGRPRPAR